MTPKQYEKWLEAFNERQDNNTREIDALNHLLGQYIAVGFNKPKDYPRKPFLYKPPPVKVMESDDIMKVMRRNMHKINRNLKKDGK